MRGKQESTDGEEERMDILDGNHIFSVICLRK